ncbi:tRNA (adenine(22)-N(1))-methyltransferase TrmK [Streptococcus didelphis]|uniref:tRNA (Adenine(22)-N(1))-methyltransferase TrmK n=1 Tax=Streptococcus didelphis TaxID=102886 RepID=A0ABY9LGY3_9STRE|nr:tRNA (adenine(22)-N(1))-methyltransferase TrmK [Streptococcus didelphis]WMB28145.1 tRNA (adenine(22)-N(1))-methyltransferase TrmK [Streptococcus didelphis]
MEINISNRLRNVADFVPQNSKLLDVGSDHAYLPIFLVENKKIQRAIAGEVVRGPYESAQKNVKEASLEGNIEVRLANGLAAFDLEDKIDVITICGMGGRLIAEILEAGKDKLSGVKRLILQANNREDDLRNWLVKNQFCLVAEKIITENNKYYEIIVAEHGQASLSKEALRFGPFLLREKSPDFVGKWQRELAKLDYALSCIPATNTSDSATIKQKIEKIKEILGNESKSSHSSI